MLTIRPCTLSYHSTSQLLVERTLRTQLRYIPPLWNVTLGALIISDSIQWLLAFTLLPLLLQLYLLRLLRPWMVHSGPGSVF